MFSSQLLFLFNGSFSHLSVSFSGIPLMIFMVDLAGRKITLATWNGLIAVLFMLLYLCMPKSALTALLFVLRALSAGLFSCAYVYTTEVSFYT